MVEKDDILQREDIKKAPLSVPEGYFDSLPEKVMQRIAAGDKQPARRVPLRKWWIAAAAACAVAIAALAIRLSPSAADTTAVAEEDEELIIEYLAYNGLGGAYIYEELAEAE